MFNLPSPPTKNKTRKQQQQQGQVRRALQSGEVFCTDDGQVFLHRDHVEDDQVLLHKDQVYKRSEMFKVQINVEPIYLLLIFTQSGRHWWVTSSKRRSTWYWHRKICWSSSAMEPKTYPKRSTHSQLAKRGCPDHKNWHMEEPGTSLSARRSLEGSDGASFLWKISQNEGCHQQGKSKWGKPNPAWKFVKKRQKTEQHCFAYDQDSKLFAQLSWNFRGEDSIQVKSMNILNTKFSS